MQIVMTENFDPRIKQIVAREVLDSRGKPTVEVDIFTENCFGRATVPSGASTGTNEALELRDGDITRYLGMGVLKAIRNVVEIISPKLIGLDVREQENIDNILIEMDGTDNKANLGANALLGVSLATAKAASEMMHKPLFKYLGGEEAQTLPVPMMNVINGGKHAGNELSIQEFMIIPIGAKRFSEALRYCSEIYHTLKKILIDDYGRSAVNVGDEGGFAPPCKTVAEALDVLLKAVNKTGYKIGDDIVLALDAAASEFYSNENRRYYIDGKILSRSELIEYYIGLLNNYPIVSLEDPLHEEDFQGFALITKKLGKRVQIVGDDLFVTNVDRVNKGLKLGAANALLLKVNQIGTLTEALRAAQLCIRNNYSVVVSHRSGETEDTFIADLAVALGSGQIKTGAPSRSERTAKYNRLLRIEESLEGLSKYAGREALSRHKHKE